MQVTWWLLREARLPLLAAVMAGFGAVISEVGAAMMVGGNIKGETRVLTTATVLEVGRGNFDVAIALSVVLLLLTYGVNLALTLIQQRRASPRRVERMDAATSRREARDAAPILRLTRRRGRDSGARVVLARAGARGRRRRDRWR